jgi:hypothetical protein
MTLVAMEDLVEVSVKVHNEVVLELERQVKVRAVEVEVLQNLEEAEVVVVALEEQVATDQVRQEEQVELAHLLTHRGEVQLALVKT